MTLKELLEKRAKVLNDQRAIVDLASKEDRGFTEAEDATLVELDKKLSDTDGLIERTKKLEAEETRAQEPVRDTLETRATKTMVTTNAEPKSFGHLGDFLMAVRSSSLPGGSIHPVLLEQRGHILEQRSNDPELRAATGLSAAVPADGGFFLQPEVEQSIFKKMYEVGGIFPRVPALTLPYGRDSLLINGFDESSRADGSRYGGIRGYWIAEAAEKTASKPKFYQVKLEPQELIVLYYATDKLLLNAPALESEVEMAVAQELMFKMEDALVNGDGAGKPLGILNAPCKITVSKESAQTATTIVTENISNMYARMWAPCRPNAVWLINQDVEPQLDKLSLQVLGTTTAGQLLYMPPGGLSEKPYGRMKGLPVIATEYNKTLGTEGDICLVDFAQWKAVRRAAIRKAMSIHVRFLYDECVFRFVMEYDAQPMWKNALTPKNGTNTLSPVITLETRS